MDHTASIRETAFYLKHCTLLLQPGGAGEAAGLTADLLDAVLGEAGRFASGVLAPLDRRLDAEGVSFADGRVTTAGGHAAAYRAFVEGGWNGLAQPVDWGGQGLPLAVNTACLELWHAGSMAFAMGTLLTMGAAETLAAHGSAMLKVHYLPKLVSGEWTATMALTEPAAGSDLGGIRTRAEPDGEGGFRLFGSKIFISYGDHDLTPNIVHLVLARLAGAPPGTRGLSLFLVPKFLPGNDGTLGERNDLRCTGIERKLGLHGSPTCTMSFGDRDGAVGWLVGEAGGGLKAMFTMMNRARLAVATQGVAVAERAFRESLAFAAERRQGRMPEGSSPGQIAAHPDVQRMLMTMRALTTVARFVTLSLADALDRSHSAGCVEERDHAAAVADVLTPVAKAFATEVGVEVAALAVQLHGGVGYVEETGVAQHLRDALVARIYEGTNGIQAIDLVSRKLPMHRSAVDALIGEFRDAAAQILGDRTVPLEQAAARLSAACGTLERATASMIEFGVAMPRRALGGATPYLKLFALVAGGAFLARAVVAGQGNPQGDGLALSFRFFAERLLPEVDALAAAVVEGADALDRVEALVGLDAAPSA